MLTLYLYIALDQIGLMTQWEKCGIRSEVNWFQTSALWPMSQTTLSKLLGLRARPTLEKEPLPAS